MSLADEPIAICGMGCRLPGEVKSPSQFWDLIINGRSAQSEVPANRFDISKWHHLDPERRGGIIARGGYFLSHDNEFRNFDPSFFGISSLEAASLDPQQRKLLEVVYETFESAGITLDQASNSQTAFYVGAFTADFSKTLQRDLEDYWPYQSTGSDMTVLSNRVNYVFNLKGPSLTVDNACSSSLYALHLACQGLILHDFDAAVVAGTSIIMDVLHQAGATKLGILSPTSTCHTFDESADGFGRAEGITALYIKRMSDAIADGDPIRAVIRATALNTNGKGIGISHPGVQGQESVIRHAYKKARLPFDETAYLECHGTGTPVGDPIEVAVAGNVFATGRTADNPILLSSVKSQVGHTEGASGVAAVQKVVMALETGVVPATIGIDKINPSLNLREGRLKIVREHQLWPEGYRRAGVNSFGYGGANAHPTISLVFKATLSQSRTLPNKAISWISHRLPLVSEHLSTTNQAFTIANSTSLSTLAPSSWVTATRRSSPARVAFVFTGQGAQWPQMGLSLLSNFRVARDTLKGLQRAMDTVPKADQLPWTLFSALSVPPEKSLMMTDVTVTVTLCTALQIVLVDILRSWFVDPIAIVGHSSGEAAAAYCAGLLTASESIIASYYRALAMKRKPNPGVMMAVGLGAKEATKYLPQGEEVYISCHNSPESVTLSGRAASIDEMEKNLKKEGVFARKVKSSGFANHSPLVEGAAEYFRNHFESNLPDANVMAQRAADGRGKMYSCITAGQVSGRDIDVTYWSKNISAPVLFDEALQNLIVNETDVDFLLEIGPHSALAGPIRQVKTFLGLDNENTMYLPSLIRGSDGVDDLLKLAGQLYLAGYPIDLKAVNAAARNPNAGEPKFIVDLPGYQWTYDQLYWVNPRGSKDWLWRKHPRHDLLGSRCPDSTTTTSIWKNKLTLSELSWVRDHKIGSSVLVPASAYVAMAVEGCSQGVDDNTEGAADVRKYVLQDVNILAPIRLEGKEREAIETVFELSITEGGAQRFRITSLTVEGKWTEHATGYISCEISSQPKSNHPTSEPKHGKVRSFELYSRFQKLGLNYGPCFQTLGEISHDQDGRAKTNISMTSSRGTMIGESKYIVHPATMDGCFQLAFAAVLDESESVQRLYLPSSIPRMTICSGYEKQSEQETDDEDAFVEGGANVCGLRSVEADFSLWQHGRTLLEGEVKFVAVKGLLGAKQEEIIPEPYQCLAWYPDVDMLEGELTIRDFLQVGEVQKPPGKLLPNGHVRKPTDTAWSFCLQKVIELLVFKRPGAALVEVGGAFESTQAVLEAVHATRRLPDASSYITIDTRGQKRDILPTHIIEPETVAEVIVDFTQELLKQGFEQDSTDILILTNLPEGCNLEEVMQAFDLILRQDARVIILRHFHERDPQQNVSEHSAWKLQFQIQGRIEVFVRQTANITNGVKPTSGKEVYLLHSNQSQPLSAIKASAQLTDLLTHSISLSNINLLPKNAVVLSLLEFEQPLISRINETHLQHLKTLFKRATDGYWLTSGMDPQMGLMQGMIKILRAEYPGLQLVNIHVEKETCNLGEVGRIVLDFATRQNDNEDFFEQSILLRDNRVWISRYILDEERNTNDLAQSKGLLVDGEFEGELEVDMKKIGDLDSFFFKEKVERGMITNGSVKVSAKAFALSRENAMTLKGTGFGRYFSDEFLGTVTEVGDGTKLEVGDIVFCLAGSKIEPEIVLSEIACLKYSSRSQALQFLGFGQRFLRAFVALVKVGRMRKGDVVMVQSEDEIFCNALGILVSRIGARLSGVDEKQKINLVIDDIGNWDTQVERMNNRFALGARILNLKSASMEKARAVADSISSTRVDVAAITQAEPEVLKEALDLMSQLFQDPNLLDPSASKSFELQRLPDAVVAALNPTPKERVILKCDTDSTVPIHRMRPSSANFSAHGTYLLVGCLGGLGRSITTWMINHGARNFIFLSRSGTDKLSAAAMVQDLLDSDLQGLTVKVVRGDVCNRPSVQRAIQAAPSPIRGVIQASTVYDDTRFEQMTSQTWQYMLAPKVVGTWNLHLETLDQQLDFFVMTSSLIGILGVTTQSHYAAANAFLDEMARYRRRRGMKGTALSLGMVTGIGRFQEDKTLEDVLLKRGAYAISETELLRMMEQACFDHYEHTVGPGVVGGSTLITALDSTKFDGFQTVPGWVSNDPRLSHIGHAIAQRQPALARSSNSSNSTISELRAMKGSELGAANHSKIMELVQKCLIDKLSSLLLTPVEKLNDSLHRPLSDLGMHSIVRTELQAWLWRELHVSLDFMELFASQRNLRGFVELVVEKWEGG